MSGVAGMAYFLVMPEIRVTKHRSTYSLTEAKNVESARISENELTPFDAVLRILHPAERRVVEVLRVHDGKYLHIKNDTGFSRLQYTE